MVEDKISNNIFLSSPVKIVWPFLILAFSWKYKITKSKCWYMYLIIIIHNQTVNTFVQKCPLHLVSLCMSCFILMLENDLLCISRLVLCCNVSIENTAFTMTFISRTKMFYKTNFLIYWNTIVCIIILFCEIVIYCFEKIVSL